MPFWIYLERFINEVKRNCCGVFIKLESKLNYGPAPDKSSFEVVAHFSNKRVCRDSRITSA
jgi:hypothetical protein